MLTDMGIHAFAERAARELRATGATVRKPTARSNGDLTPQETQIARLASEGLSNPEIGSRLFLSPRTVEYHLRKVFAKLQINSRKELMGETRLTCGQPSSQTPFAQVSSKREDLTRLE